MYHLRYNHLILNGILLYDNVCDIDNDKQSSMLPTRWHAAATWWAAGPALSHAAFPGSTVSLTGSLILWNNLTKPNPELNRTKISSVQEEPITNQANILGQSEWRHYAETQYIRMMGQAAVMADRSILLLGGQVCFARLISLFVNFYFSSSV